MGMTARQQKEAANKAAHAAANAAQNAAKKTANRAAAAAANAARNSALIQKKQLQTEADNLDKQAENYFKRFCNPSTNYYNTMNDDQKSIWMGMNNARDAKQAAADAVVVPSGSP